MSKSKVLRDLDDLEQFLKKVASALSAQTNSELQSLGSKAKRFHRDLEGVVRDIKRHWEED